MSQVVTIIYLGAFAPLHSGHIECAKKFIRQAKKDYRGHKINLVFMPTAKLVSKKYLEYTKNSRILTLQRTCVDLMKKYPDIRCIASTLEYDIYEETQDTSSIFTFIKMKHPFSGKLIAAMGFDNMLQLPFWERVEEYYGLLHGIYVINRKISLEESGKVNLFQIKDGSYFEFQSVVPWDLSEEVSLSRFEVLVHKGDNLLDKISKLKINFDLPKITIINGEVKDLSSTMVRYFLYRTIVDNSNFIDKIKYIIFETESIDENQTMLLFEIIKEYSKFFNLEKISETRTYRNNCPITLSGQKPNKIIYLF